MARRSPSASPRSSIAPAAPSSTTTPTSSRAATASRKASPRGVLSRARNPRQAHHLRDDNGISIDGEVEQASSTPMRFAAYGLARDPERRRPRPAAGRGPRHRGRADDSSPRSSAARPSSAKNNWRTPRSVHGARGARRQGSGRHAREAIGWAYPPFEIPQPSTPRGTSARAAALEASGSSASPRTSPRTPSSRGIPTTAAWPPATCRRTGRGRRRDGGQGAGQGGVRRHAQGLAARDRGHRPTCRIPRRLGRPHRVQPHQLVGLRR